MSVRYDARVSLPQKTAMRGSASVIQQSELAFSRLALAWGHLEPLHPVDLREGAHLAEHLAIRARGIALRVAGSRSTRDRERG